MKTVKFGDVVRRANTKEDRFNTDKIYYVGGEHIETGELLVTKRGLIAGSTIGPMFYFGFHAGQVLLASRSPDLKKSGKVTFDGICSEKTFVIEPVDESVLTTDYLTLIVSSERFWRYANDNASGSVNHFVNWSTYAKYEFELPSVGIQNRITKLMWAMNDTRSAYKNLLVQTDELIKSQFIEMFGNIREHIYLEDCCTIHARVGWQALKKEEYLDNGEYMLITGTDFKEGKVDFSTCVYVSKERYDMDEKIQVQNGDILITKDGTIGKVAVVEGLEMPATLNAGVFVVRPDGRYNRDFFSYLFKGPVFEDFVEQMKSGSTIKHLNQGKLVKYEIPVVDMEMQNRFAEIYKQSDKSKLELKESIANIENMMSALINSTVFEEG